MAAGRGGERSEGGRGRGARSNDLPFRECSAGGSHIGGHEWISALTTPGGYKNRHRVKPLTYTPRCQEQYGLQHGGQHGVHSFVVDSKANVAC